MEGRQATFNGVTDEKLSAAAKAAIMQRLNYSPARKTITACQRYGMNLGRGFNFEWLRSGQMAHLPEQFVLGSLFLGIWKVLPPRFHPACEIGTI